MRLLLCSFEFNGHSRASGCGWAVCTSSHAFIYSFMNMTDVMKKLEQYCREYQVPMEYLFEILEDQKVVPMIRGKATEYNVYLYLKNHLEADRVWSVEKLNLNAQSGENYDEDVSITHRKTGIRLKVECKNAVRGSISGGTKQHPEPHFKVKCHRSRSNMQKDVALNDRYVVGEFDLLVCNTLNAIYLGNTIEKLEITDNEKALSALYSYYQISDKNELISVCAVDFRFCIPSDIAEEIAGEQAIPRTPYVLLDGDAHWTTLDKLEDRLLRIVESKKRQRRK